jgi:hypothetical protein
LVPEFSTKVRLVVTSLPLAPVDSVVGSDDFTDVSWPGASLYAVIFLALAALPFLLGGSAFGRRVA